MSGSLRSHRHKFSGAHLLAFPTTFASFSPPPLASMAIKDVLQSLVDDGMVHCEKIGTSNYYWAFPSEGAVIVCFPIEKFIRNVSALPHTASPSPSASFRSAIIKRHSWRKNWPVSRPSATVSIAALKRPEKVARTL